MLCVDYVYTCVSKTRHGWGHQRAGSGITPSPTLFETMTRCLLLFLPSWLAHSFWDSPAVSSHLTSSSLWLQICVTTPRFTWCLITVLLLWRHTMTKIAHSFKKICLEVCSQFQRFSTSLLWQGTRQHEIGARAVTESYTLTHRQGEILGLAWSFGTSKPCWLPSTRPNLLIFSILSNSAILW